jgi:ankyrin repeat protein
MSDRVSNDPNTALTDALGDITALRSLIESGIRVQRTNDRLAAHPLNSAALDNNLEAMKLLLTVGGKNVVNDFDELSWTPLTYAAKNANLEMIDLLLKNGADINARDEALSGNTTLREVVDSAPFIVVNHLIECGADPLIRGFMQISALVDAEQRFKERRDEESKRILDLLQRVAADKS